MGSTWSLDFIVVYEESGVDLGDWEPERATRLKASGRLLPETTGRRTHSKASRCGRGESREEVGGDDGERRGGRGRGDLDEERRIENGGERRGERGVREGSVEL